MSINPFRKMFTRDRYLPSADPTPFVISEGKVMTNVAWVDASTALKNSDIYAVISLIASDVSSCEFVMPAPYMKVFDRPNNLTNEFSFWQSVVAQMCLSGNAYVWIGRDGNNMPNRLEVIPPDNVQIILQDNATGLDYKFSFDDERDQITVGSKDVLHFKLMSVGSQNNQYVGISPLQSLVNEVNIQDYATKMSLGALKNAIAPSYTLTAPEGVLEPEAKENIRTAFEQQNSGANVGRAIVLDQGLQLGTLKVDADIVTRLNDVDWTRQQITKAFGVPKDMLNSESEHSNGDTMRSFYATSLNRYLNPIVSELQAKFGVKVRYDITPAIDPDNSKFVTMIEALSTGKAPVLSSEQAIQALKQKGVLKID